MSEMAHCRSCKAPIVWVLTASGARMPVDAKPEKRIVLTPDGRRPDAAPRAEVVDTYVSHFATCAHAAEHRKAKP